MKKAFSFSLLTLSAAIGCVIVSTTSLAGAQSAPLTSLLPGAPPVKFASVKKIFDANCIGCHGATRPRGGIDLRTYESVIKGGERGKIVTPKDTSKSVLWTAVSYKPGMRPMPPKGKLADADLKLIEAWITQGAKK